MDLSMKNDDLKTLGSHWQSLAVIGSHWQSWQIVPRCSNMLQDLKYIKGWPSKKNSVGVGKQGLSKHYMENVGRKLSFAQHGFVWNSSMYITNLLISTGLSHDFPWFLPSVSLFHWQNLDQWVDVSWENLNRNPTRFSHEGHGIFL